MQKTAKPASKLTLSRQTVRVLTPSGLEAVAGGCRPQPETNNTEQKDCLICIPEFGGTCVP
jgi:hypothetical protein